MDFDGNFENVSEGRDDDGNNGNSGSSQSTTPWGSSGGSGFSLWEDQLIRETTESNDVESQMTSEKETTNHRLWLLFQASACSIAQLYRDRTQGVSMWLPFQSAASNVTNLYRECIDSQKKLTELCIQSGVQRRNHDLLKWVKSKKRSTIRRDELIAFICGKSVKNLGSNHSSNNHGIHRSPRRMTSCSTDSFSSMMMNPPTSTVVSSPSFRSPQTLTFSCLSLSDSATVSGGGGGAGLTNLPDSNSIDVQPFRDAFALSTISPPSTTTLSRNRSPRGSSPSKEDLQELNAFIMGEFSRNLDSKKRPYSATTSDIVMTSPTHKKPKYL